MSPYVKKQNEKRRKSFFRKWHRRIGFTAAIFLFNLAITGILLNHYEDLNLHNKYVTSDWIINWYGLKAPDDIFCVSYEKVQESICQLGEKIYYGDKLLIDNASPLVGMLEQNNLLYLSTSSAIYIYTPEMELVEVSSSDSGLPTPVHKLLSLKSNQHLAEKTLAIVSNDQIFLFDQNEMIWEKSKRHSIDKLVLDISEKQPLLRVSGEQSSKLKNLYLDHQITLLKLVQDLHSGSILSLLGRLLTDLTGLIAILLAISGFIAWQRRKDISNV